MNTTKAPTQPINTPKFNPTAAVLLKKGENGKIEVKTVVKDITALVPFVRPVDENGKKGKPVLDVPGHFVRGLMTVSQVAKTYGLSKNKASHLRDTCPLVCMYDFPGQQPLAQDLATAHNYLVQKLVA